MLGDAYLHTLRALNAYVSAQNPTRVEDATQHASPTHNFITTSGSEQRYRTLMAVCGLE